MFYVIQYEEPVNSNNPYSASAMMTADVETFDELVTLLKSLHDRITAGEEIERIVINVIPF